MVWSQQKLQSERESERERDRTRETSAFCTWSRLESFGPWRRHPSRVESSWVESPIKFIAKLYCLTPNNKNNNNKRQCNKSFSFQSIYLLISLYTEENPLGKSKLKKKRKSTAKTTMENCRQKKNIKHNNDKILTVIRPCFLLLLLLSPTPSSSTQIRNEEADKLHQYREK